MSDTVNLTAQLFSIPANSYLRLLSSDINIHNSSDNNAFNADLCSNNCSHDPTIISENFVSPDLYALPLKKNPTIACPL